MSASSRVRVYMACSLDGFIAGRDDDLSWLEPPSDGAEASAAPSSALEFDAFMSQVGAMLMGRRTYDVIAAMGQWIYGDVPVLVLTHRDLAPVAETVEPVAGTIEEVIALAKERAGSKDVYIDGGNLIQQALNAGLVDELVLTIVPILLGEGIRLFDGLVSRQRAVFESHHRHGQGNLQLTIQLPRD